MTRRPAAARRTRAHVVVGPEAAGKRLDVALAAALAEVSRTQLARHIAEGCVTVNGQPAAAPSQKLRAGDVVVWQPPPVVPVALRGRGRSRCTSCTRTAGCWCSTSRPGLVVHPAPGHEAGTLVNALLAHCTDLRGIGGELRPGIVHRLDRGHLRADGGGQGRRRP